jgi:FKBP-type peptidyl-prolyl cis-trans isomerase FkpA
VHQRRAVEMNMLCVALSSALLLAPSPLYRPPSPFYRSALRHHYARAALEDGAVIDQQQALEDAAAEPGAIETPSGLVIQEIIAGTGDVPTLDDKVRVHYEGRLVDGTVFDSTLVDGRLPQEFQNGAVIQGWTEALQRMQVGAMVKLTVPANLAYGERGSGPVPPGATLIFDVELLEITTDDGYDDW